MSLHPHVIAPVPGETARVACAAFPKGHPYLTFRDALGTIFQDEDFTALFPTWGHPALPPWRLALVTIMQFRENLADRQEAEAVRARIDWKYLLSLELTDPGFDFSVLSEFRDRLLAGNAEALLLDKLLERCRTMGWLKARGQQRTDSTHVLAAIREMSRLELVAETLRAALNALATVAPTWVQAITPTAWYERYGKRVEDTRLPQGRAEREAYAQLVGEDGVTLLEALEAPETPAALQALPRIAVLRQVWQRQYERLAGDATPRGLPAGSRIRFKPARELSPSAEGVQSPYDPDARYRQKRDTTWVGYMVHVSETCEPTAPHLLTHMHTTPATVHEALCTTTIHQALVEKDLAPQEHLVDSAYISRELLVDSRDTYDIRLRGPARPSPDWQRKVEGAYPLSSLRSIGTIVWSSVRKARHPGGGMTTRIGRGGRTVLCNFISATVVPVRRASAVRGVRSRPGASISPPGPRSRRRLRPARGRRVRRANSSMPDEPGWKGRCRKASARLASGAAAIEASRRRIYSMWPQRRRSISTGSWRGWRSARAPRRGPHASPRWRLSRHRSPARQLPEVLCHLAKSNVDVPCGAVTHAV